MNDTVTMAFDKAGRYFDKDGRMHVPVSHISKATVNPYRGAEIPGYKDLGLDPDRVYKLLRCPEELAKAAPTFNNLPVLDIHIPVSSKAFPKDNVVGTTGTDCVFVAPYLDNSMAIWTDEAIAGVETQEQHQLSSAYHYTPDMTPGEYEGLTYDGVMRNIVGNHVTLVEVGRAGSDVIVGDAQMKKPLRSRKALLVHGALAAYLGPKLAQDAKIDLTSILQTVTAKNFVKSKDKIVAAVKSAAAGKLAMDADISDVVDLLDAMGSVDDLGPDAIEEIQTDPALDPPIDDNPPAVDGEGDVVAKILAFLEGKLSEEDLAEIGKLAAAPSETAIDEPPPFEGKPKDPAPMDKPAMDAAIAKATTDALARMKAIRVAEKDVQPYVGEVVAMDSAAAVYKFALDSLSVDVTGVHPSAYPAILKAQPKAGAEISPRIAQDAASVSDFNKMFPDAARIRSV